METEFDTKMQELANALVAYKAEHPEEFASIEAELQQHLEAINDILAGKA